jgi:hypothetical protein
VAGLRTEFPFTLPKGFVDPEGRLHRHGTMRLATARDEIEPLRDRNVTGPDDPYLTILVLARVISELGTLDGVSPGDVENFFAADLAFLQDLYGIINFGDPADVEALQESVLPVERPVDDRRADDELVSADEFVSGEPDSDAQPDSDDGHDGETDEAALLDAELLDAGPGDSDGVSTIGSGGSRRRGHIEEVRRTGSS